MNITGSNSGHPVAPDWRPEALPVAELLVRSARQHPDRIALDFMGRTWRYDALLEGARAAAAGFQRIGVRPGTRVGLFLPNTPHYPIAYHGALLAGATVVNFSPLYSPDEVAFQARDSGTEVMVCLDLKRLWAPMQRLLDKGMLRNLVVGSLVDVLPPLRSLGFRLLKRGERQDLPQYERVVRWSTFLRSPAELKPVEVDPRSIALLQYTGGTTGVPKGAALTHANLTANAQQLAAIDPGEGERTARVLAALPLFHIFANSAVLNRSLMSGGTLYLLARFDAGEALAVIRRGRMTDLCGVPAMFQAMIDHPDVARTNFDSVQQCFSGGAAMTAVLKERFERTTGARVLEGYGLTETSGVVAVNPFVGETRAGTVGLPLPATEIRITDPENPDRVLAGGETGELQIKGPQVMVGYWQAAVEAPDPLPGGWLRTGDLGFVESGGYLRLVDRSKDMINVGGFKVFPSQVEAALLKHAAVKECLVIAVPDERVGERPKAFAVLNEGAEASPTDLMTALCERIGKHERPVAIEILDDLPRTMIGKPDRKALTKMDAERRAAATS
ncbi:AMP-binding protein [Sphingomonas glaciei]|uniref:AMP-binding protein n=1 Tax=Sphingomonas glaciei TaxID=2938948 RepID=A0ABY5MVY4_9SPHN|nr:AMP-binding protein [Sphingomonas glaciei]UUR08607.1 AMP-binding protein [Sphingomonas glaciei]